MCKLEQVYSSSPTARPGDSWLAGEVCICCTGTALKPRQPMIARRPADAHAVCPPVADELRHAAAQRSMSSPLDSGRSRQLLS